MGRSQVSNWFADKLGDEAPARPNPGFVIVPPMSRPLQPPVYPGQQNFPPTYAPALNNPVQAPQQAVSAQQTGRCPRCGSGNYMKASPTSNKAARCFDCGYAENDRIAEQSGAGLGGTTSGPVRAARQVSTANNFHPEIIVGHA